MMKKKIFDKIKALKRKAESAKELGNINEYLAFVGKVKQLMDKHLIEWYEVELENDNPSITASITQVEFPYSRNWQKYLLDTLATAHYCRLTWIGKLRKMIVTGRIEQLDVVEWLYNFLHTYFLSQSKTYPARLQHSFLTGCVAGVDEVIDQVVQTNQTQGLMLYNKEAIDQYYQEQDIEIIKSKLVVNYDDSTAYQEGIETGKNVRMDERKITPTSKQQTLI